MACNRREEKVAEYLRLFCVFISHITAKATEDEETKPKEVLALLNFFTTHILKNVNDVNKSLDYARDIDVLFTKAMIEAKEET